MMKSKLLGFERAHSLVLCLLYLPIPEYIATLFFRGEGVTGDILSVIMILEILVAIVVYAGFHNCPGCGEHVPQIRLHGNCKCHSCGYDLLALEQVADFMSEAKHDETVAEEADGKTSGLLQN